MRDPLPVKEVLLPAVLKSEVHFTMKCDLKTYPSFGWAGREPVTTTPPSEAFGGQACQGSAPRLPDGGCDCGMYWIRTSDPLPVKQVLPACLFILWVLQDSNL